MGFQDLVPSQTVLTALIGADMLYITLRSKVSLLRSLPLPPGPQVTSWLSGHLSIVPATKPWKLYTKWAEKYGVLDVYASESLLTLELGPVIHLRIYGQHTIILSSIDDCIEVFEKRSNLYSDRPVLTMIDL